MRLLTFITGLGVSLTLAVGMAGAATQSSTFDSDAEGWIGNPGQGALTYVATGGNPDGHIRITDIGAGSNNGFASGALAGPAWLGDLSAFDGGTFSIDLATFIGSTGTFSSFGTLILFNGATSVSADIVPIVPAAGTGWQTFSAVFGAATFGVSQGDWLGVLGNVTLIGFATDGFDGADTIGIDNVTLSSKQVSTIPLPAGAVLLVSALAGLAALRRRK